MRHIPAWVYLAVVFALFWMVFAAVLITADFPFFVIGIALTTVAMLSLLIIALLWAYQNNW